MPIDPTIDNFKDAYATYTGFSDYSYKSISYLMDNSELIWKYLKYNGADAWNKTDLTHDEKAELIYNGQPDTTPYRVFMDSGNPDAWTREICQLRIYPCKLFSQNRTQGIVLMEFDFFCHYKINQLSNYKTRSDSGIEELIRVFNGINLAGIGRLHFNGAESAEDKVLGIGQLPFKGKAIYMSNKEI